MVSALKRHQNAGKFETRILGDIERMLLAAGPDDRDMNYMHPGDICKTDWCPRQSFYYLTKTEPDSAETKVSRIMEGIWEQGHDAHRKYQRWIDDLGRLRGTWECAACESFFEATSPRQCPECGARRLALVYREVVFLDEHHHILGHADGDIDEGHEDIADDPLIEIKTIAEGTVRIEAPKLLYTHTHKVTVDGKQATWVDLRTLWRNIRRPFPTHLRQGMLYGVLLGRKQVVYIYEFKPTGVTKEFVIKVDKAIVADILDQALDVKWAVSKNRVPDRPSFAEGPDTKVCKECVFRGTCWGLVAPAIGEQGEGEDRRRVRVVKAGHGGRSEAGAGRSGLASPASGRSAHLDHPASGLRRRQPDQPDGTVHGVARLPERPAGNGGDRRAVRRVRRLPG